VRGERTLAWVCGLILLALHLDFWRPKRAVLMFDWLPEELLYRLGWMGLAYAFLLWISLRIWRPELDREEPRP
jgi:hypothetical protein